MFEALVQGSEYLLSPTLWILVLIGFTVGVVVGALPGVGLTLTYGLALPFTFHMDAVNAVAFLLAISVGGQYGNSIPAIVMGLPGSPATVMTVADGYALHRQGQTGMALGVQLVAAFVGQVISVLFFIALVVPLSGLAYLFLAPELFALYLVGMMAIVSLTGKSMVKGFIAAAIGISVGLIGLDPVSATPRFDFGIRELRNGIDTAPVLIGLLAVGELFRQARQTFSWSELKTDFDAKFPPWREIRRLWPFIGVGTVTGTLVGAIPGAGTTPATLISYQQAQMLSKTPEKFGRGSTEGIAANEAAQNASNAGELIPTLGFGIPASGSTALLLAALSIQGFVPGPQLATRNPEMLAAAVAGMFAGSILILLTGWWQCKLLLKAVGINRAAVLIVSLALVVLGVYSLQFRIFDVVVCLVFGVIGYFMLRYGFAPAAAALAAILAADFERTFRQGLNLVDNNIITFATRPLTAVILLVAVGIAIYGFGSQKRMRRIDAKAAAILAAAEAEEARSLAAYTGAATTTTGVTGTEPAADGRPVAPRAATDDDTGFPEDPLLGPREGTTGGAGAAGAGRLSDDATRGSEGPDR
jgi:putative tricarboxylic transport membrane protein